jgi:hypothetical protein
VVVPIAQGILLSEKGFEKVDEPLLQSFVPGVAGKLKGIDPEADYGIIHRPTAPVGIGGGIPFRTIIKGIGGKELLSYPISDRFNPDIVRE